MSVTAAEMMSRPALPFCRTRRRRSSDPGGGYHRLDHAGPPSQEASMNANDIMTSPALTVPQDASLADAIRIMLARGVSGVPVVDGDGRLVGILTEGDLLRRI